MNSLLIIMGLATVLFLYFLPSIVGHKKKNASAIFLLNLLLGWSLIGWVVAFVWASTKEGEAEDHDLKKCPQCAEFVKSEAKVCRFCGFAFARESPSAYGAAVQPSPPELKQEVLQDRSEYLVDQFNRITKQIVASRNPLEIKALRDQRDQIAKEIAALKKGSL
jgi:hypothetical protein